MTRQVIKTNNNPTAYLYKDIKPNNQSHFDL